MSQQSHLRPPLVVGACALALALFLVLAARAFGAATVAQPKANGVTQKADDVELPASLKTGIPIYDTEANAEAHPVVVYSDYAPGLQSGDKLRVEGSTHMSYCNNSDIKGNGNAGSPCRTLTGTNGPGAAPADPYHYTVQLEMHAYQSTSPTAPSSTAQTDCGAITDPQTNLKQSCVDWLTYTHRDLPCTSYVHHCSFTVKNTDATANTAGPYVNVELVAWVDPTELSTSNWELGQMIELEGDCINDTTYSNCSPQPNDDQRTKSKGQLSLVRLGSGYPSDTGPFSHETQLTQSTLDINTSGTTSPQVVYSKKIQNVETGDVIEAPMGRMDLDGTHPCVNLCNPSSYVFNHDVQIWWLLATDPKHEHVLNNSERYISGNNQQNCWKLDANGNPISGQCTMQQLGAVTAPKPPRSHTMYLNLVAAAKDSTGASDPAGGKPKVQLSTNDPADGFDLRCDPLAYPDPGLNCAF